MSSSYYAHLSELYKNFDPSNREQLLPVEHFWLEHQKWLESHGYMLRPRYRPGWIPSWKGTDKWFMECEDSKEIYDSNVMDATRISDGFAVAIKKIIISDNPDEVEMNKFLSSEPRASHPRNHCLPALEILQVPEEDEMFLIVMPFARSYDDPRFETIGEAVEFFRQIFEGIQFMHEQRVAHRDCCRGNIMMDGSRMYPNGYHPIYQERNPDFHGNAKHYSRTERPPKYYLVDFGLSRRFEPGRPPLALPVRGKDKTVPEFQGEDYYELSDPFPTDIYYLGNMIKTRFTDVYFGFDFISPLIADMTQDEPSNRPTIDEVVSRFEAVYRSLSTAQLRSRIIKRKVDPFGWWRSSIHLFRTIRYILKRIPPLPRHSSRNPSKSITAQDPGSEAYGSSRNASRDSSGR